MPEVEPEYAEPISLVDQARRMLDEGCTGWRGLASLVPFLADAVVSLRGEVAQLRAEVAELYQREKAS